MKSEEIGVLKIGEHHPAADGAFAYVKQRLINDLMLLEAFSSCAIENNRLAEICGETLRRIAHGEPVSDRYVLGLAWVLKEMEGSYLIPKE